MMSRTGDARAGRETGTVQVTEQHLPALARFLTTVWGSDSTADDLRQARRQEAARNPVTPGSVPPSFAFLDGDRVVGYITTIPTRLWNGVEEMPASWLKGLMVLPEYRNGPVGYAVLRHATRAMAEVGPIGGFVVARPARRLFSALGYADVATLSNDVLPLSPGKLLARVNIEALASVLPARLAGVARKAQRTGLAAAAGVAAALPFRARAAWSRVRARGLATVEGFDAMTDAGLDALWRRARNEVRVAAVRDAAYLRWRYQDDEAYAVVGIGQGTELAGLAAVRRPESDGTLGKRPGVRVAVLSDLLFPVSRPAVARGLLTAAERVARREQADALVCSVSHPLGRAALRSHGFVPLPGTVHLLLHGADAAALPKDPDSLWLTRGDASSDEGFTL